MCVSAISRSLEAMLSCDGRAIAETPPLLPKMCSCSVTMLWLIHCRRVRLGVTSRAYLDAMCMQAFGYEGLGLVAVRNVPGMSEARDACLPYSHRFGSLPEEVKRKYELPEAFYSFGWSHGKEKLEGKPDTAKGSFYFNPIADKPIADPKLVEKYPTFAHPNIWPTEEDCPGMAHAAKACGKLIAQTGLLLSKHCDNYVESVLPSYGKEGASKTSTLSHVISHSRCHKARLLYYFPFSKEADAGAAGGAGASASAEGEGFDVSSWCGWHNDHGASLGGCAHALSLLACSATQPERVALLLCCRR